MGFNYIIDYQLIKRIRMSKNVRFCPSVDIKYGAGAAARFGRLLPLFGRLYVCGLPVEIEIVVCLFVMRFIGF